MKEVARRALLAALLCAILAWPVLAQTPAPGSSQDSGQTSSSGKKKRVQSQQPSLPQSQPMPRSEDSSQESSSKDTKTDLSAPSGDERGREGAAGGDVTEFHSYDPHRAEKDIEVGDFYFKRKNYRAAASRYAGALQWKPNDADATFKLAQALENLGKLAEARQNYQAYLKILPYGPYAEEAKQGVARLDAKLPPGSPPPSPPISRRADKPR
jgi:tetratricopeptide (TPR) repeat protein